MKKIFQNQHSILMLLTIFFFAKLSINQILPLSRPISCPQKMINFNGICYPEIVGCLNYKSPNQCFICDNTLQLNNGICEPNTQNFIPFIPFIPNNSFKQKDQAIKGQNNSSPLTFLNKQIFQKIKDVAALKYPNMTSNYSQPQIIDILPTAFQIFISFTWLNGKNITFLFQYSIDLDNNVTQLQADQFDPNLKNSLFSGINARIIQKYGNKLTQSTLTRIEAASKNLYKLHYYSDFGFHYVSFVQKIPFLEIKSLQSLPLVYNETQMINYIYSQHFFLAKQDSYAIKRRNSSKSSQYEINFASGTKVVVELIESQSEQIIFFYRQENQTIDTASKLVGGYQVFKNNQDQIVSKVLNHLFSQFTFLKDAQITKIQYQIVAGTNFLIYLKDSITNDQYICKLFYSLSGEINILQIYLNSVLIHTQPLSPVQVDARYDYNSDQQFDKVSSYLKNVSNITISQILYVNKQKKTNDIETFYQFEIVFQENSYIVVNFFQQGPRQGQIQMVDYIENGDNKFQYKYSSQARIKIKRFLENYRKWLHPLSIQYLKQTKPNEYLCKIITGQGSYFYKVIERVIDKFEIYYYELIDKNEKCMTHSIDQLKQFQFSQKFFISKLFSNYNIDPNSQLISFQEGVYNFQTRYRLLFVNPINNKKVQVFLYGDINNYQVQSVRQQNNGFSILTNLGLYQNAVRKSSLVYYDSLQNSKSLFGMINEKEIRLYFAQKSNSQQIVYEVSLDLNLQKSTFKTFFSQNPSNSCKNMDQNGKCLDCKDSQVALLSNCYQKIKSCMTQIGQNCMICDQQYILQNNTCINQCSYTM